MVFDDTTFTPSKKEASTQLQPKIIMQDCEPCVAISTYFSREARNLDFFRWNLQNLSFRTS